MTAHQQTVELDLVHAATAKVADGKVTLHFTDEALPDCGIFLTYHRGECIYLNFTGMDSLRDAINMQFIPWDESKHKPNTHQLVMKRIIESGEDAEIAVVPAKTVEQALHFGRLMLRDPRIGTMRTRRF
ncbi:hypothetical protein B6S44_23975 [Bosea sp. Tri-44]|uniref:hypothetical protein n=1 Tax=Bosea sp. Tri-44 TaxID=1972137 RepID=UPI00100EB834|nr:hypothetical protein [Bosea sp. Tri-44]RXT48132.1 hypothetical protein B6S44_23975 [Bosea sp. Tri-44]